MYEETSGDMMVPEGSSAKLVCKARGFPKPKITWRREDGREIIARNGPHGKSKGKFNTKLKTCSNFRKQMNKIIWFSSVYSVSSWRWNVVVNQNNKVRNGNLFVYRYVWNIYVTIIKMLQCYEFCVIKNWFVFPVYSIQSGSTIGIQTDKIANTL